LILPILDRAIVPRELAGYTLNASPYVGVRLTRGRAFRRSDETTYLVGDSSGVTPLLSRRPRDRATLRQHLLPIPQPYAPKKWMLSL
jgi:hypothetical protein